ncbi:hypothetical protein INR75_00495 [Zunongwangia sp. SCSIO 43204]|uniref:carboxypeptidase-like regulatory domain-containing protein n=1 Tax=Zunongwangia sp. SCSIO 43204 TaxID=2779359 RepID=UPI001CA8D720|nr:carboxypeptidase-like regulatory domain-containing protein [Zunongwangia sp. SCSIO 43204]UAB84556.1 hypothetical protein INR75_00495 [Zunongwangia sp. SCSIO 43204]
MRNQVLLVFVLAMPAIGFSQSKVIEGKIVADSLDGSLINIVNTSLGRGTTSDKFGYFTISASVNDIILFSSIQYKKKEILIDSSVYKKGFLIVELQLNVNQLDEVILPSLSGNLALDIKSFPVNDKYALNAPMSRQESLSHEEKLLYTATTGPGGTRFKWYGLLLGSVPLDPVINGISGRTKMLKKLNKNIREEKELETELDLRKSFLLEKCHLTEEQVYLFINYCFAQPGYRELLKDPDKLKLLEYYKKASTEFLGLLAKENIETKSDSNNLKNP